jgi:predicted RNase H-like HicB family nuclease
MLTKYIQTAMHQATYELLEDGTFYAEIAGFQGVYANAETLEACRDLLQEVLEGWIILGLRLQHQLSVVDNIDFNLCPLAPKFGGIRIDLCPLAPKFGGI